LVRVENRETNTYPKAAVLVPSITDAKFQPSCNAICLNNAPVCQPFNCKNYPLDSTKTLKTERVCWGTAQTDEREVRRGTWIRRTTNLRNENFG